MCSSNPDAAVIDVMTWRANRCVPSVTRSPPAAAPMIDGGDVGMRVDPKLAPDLASSGVICVHARALTTGSGFGLKG